MVLLLMDLCSLNPDDVKTDILTPSLQNGSMSLQASDFNLQTVNTNSQEIAAEIDGKIIKLAWHQVCASIFDELCPNYSNQPHAAIKHIRQSYVDFDGNIMCTSSVFAYYQRMMNAMRPFAGEAQFPKSVCNALIDGLNKRLVAIFRQNYKLRGSHHPPRLERLLPTPPLPRNTPGHAIRGGGSSVDHRHCAKFCLQRSSLPNSCSLLSKPG